MLWTLSRNVTQDSPSICSESIIMMYASSALSYSNEEDVGAFEASHHRYRSHYSLRVHSDSWVTERTRISLYPPDRRSAGLHIQSAQGSISLRIGTEETKRQRL
ncbi:hypothetical protein EYF80_006334 [Liparis tanakae]|uniref:Uncharacterized protein n=1 Tax=Liparis tanakae TaxID=230148 RepID=A0A4Z2J1N6_9TELE|nr:hypothetical protein EYF80_006334 [Liparis tanakae]